MNKLNNYLLTHYPLLWNLRLHWLWPAILLLHLLFWAAGYSAVSFPEDAGYYYAYHSLGPGPAAFSMSILCGLLLLALWLIFYFRNNAFKSFYPLAKGRLVAEFGLSLLTAFGLTTFVASYAGGSYMHVRQNTKNEDLITEINTVNLAHHFLPFSRQSFSVREDCNYDHSTHRAEMASGDDEPVADTGGRRDNGTATDTFSYLHYCANATGYYYNRYEYNGSRIPAAVLSAGASDTIAKRWLYGGQRDSVARVLTNFLAICKKYQGGYKYDVEKGVAEVFATPGFLVRGVISEDKYSAENFNRHEAQLQPGAYIETRQVVNALSTIGIAREGWLGADTMLAFLYFSLAIALLVFSFRATSTRVWFISLIGMAVWMAVFGVTAAITRGSETGMMTMFLLLSAGFLIAGALQIYRRSSRRNAGVMLIWALWSFPVNALFIASLVEKAMRPWPGADYGIDETRPLAITHPAYYWIQHHWTLINYLNLMLTFAAVCVLFIPLLRRWRAAPEE